METRDIKNKDNQVIGQLSLPEGTSEAVWTAKLNEYKQDVSLSPSYAVQYSIKQRKEFADQLLEEFKAKNISDGINGLQAMYMHHKLRALPVTFMGLSMTLDLLNMAISGDVEVAALSLLNCTPDDMSQPYHWLSAERRDWLVAKMKAFLGWS
jgi:hypothetical protein